MALPSDCEKAESPPPCTHLSPVIPPTRIYFTCVCKAVTGCTARKVEDRTPGPPRGHRTVPPAATAPPATAAAAVDPAYVAGYDAATGPECMGMLKETPLPSSARVEMRTVMRMTTSGFHNHPSSLGLKRRRRRDAATSATAAPVQEDMKCKEPLSVPLEVHCNPGHAPLKGPSENPFATIPPSISVVPSNSPRKTMGTSSKAVTDLVPSVGSLVQAKPKEARTFPGPAVHSQGSADTMQQLIVRSMCDQIMALSKDPAEISQAEGKLSLQPCRDSSLHAVRRTSYLPGELSNEPSKRQRATPVEAKTDGQLERRDTSSCQEGPWPACRAETAPQFPTASCTTQGVQRGSLVLPHRFPDQTPNPVSPAGQAGPAGPAEPAHMAASAFAAGPAGQTAPAASTAAPPHNWQIPACAKAVESSNCDVATLLVELLTPAELEVVLSRVVQREGPLGKGAMQLNGAFDSSSACVHTTQGVSSSSSSSNSSSFVGVSGVADHAPAASMDAGVASGSAAAAAAGGGGGAAARGGAGGGDVGDTGGGCGSSAAAVAATPVLGAAKVLHALDACEDLNFVSQAQLRASSPKEPLPSATYTLDAASAPLTAASAATPSVGHRSTTDQFTAALLMGAAPLPNSMGAAHLTKAARLPNSMGAAHLTNAMGSAPLTNAIGAGPLDSLTEINNKPSVASPILRHRSTPHCITSPPTSHHPVTLRVIKPQRICL
ncbi:unnamed protein product [Closterium sp. NIES-53]